MLTKGQKLAFLQMMLEQKPVLMAQFSPIITRKSKKLAWEKIRVGLLSIGLDEEELANIAVLRDRMWPNLKKTTMAKIQEQSETGGKGGSKLSEIDEAVLDIIGRTSPAMKPLSTPNLPLIFDSIPSTSTAVEAQPEVMYNNEQLTLVKAEEFDDESKHKIRKLCPTSVSSQAVNALAELRAKKLRLDIIHCRLQNKKIRLEIKNMQAFNEIPVVIDT